MARWTTANIPSQGGKLAVVTGTGGLGYEDALALARAGAQVMIAGRNADKGAEAVMRIMEEHPQARVLFEQLDLANLASAKSFCDRLCDRYDRLDLLINNAAVMMPPQRQETEDGFELQFGTNYLGHFALTAGLLPLLQKAQNPRVVTLSSIASRSGAIDFANLNAERNYSSTRAYSQSKLACLMFALELHRRSAAEGWGIDSIAAHPGIARTDLLHNAPGRWSVVGLTRSLFGFVLQPAERGALPTLFAATSPLAESGRYYGPDRFNELRGFPALATIPPQGLDENVSKRLWETSEQLTGIAFP